MPTVLLVLVISSGALLLGAAILGAFMGGIVGVLSAPLLAIFGWFYFIPIVAFVSAFWFGLRPRLATGTPRLLLMLAGGLMGAAFMGYFGIKEQGRIVRDTAGYVTGGAVSGAAAVWCITIVRPFPKRRENESQ